VIEKLSKMRCFDRQ